MTATPRGALSITPEQTDWTPEQAAALGWTQKAPSRGEALRFLQLCQRTGLDPFANQLYLIERGGRWATQTGIDGFRVIRDRLAQQRGLAVGYDDTLFCGPDGGWTEAWLQPTPPAACKVTVTVRSAAGEARFSQVALWREYGSDGGMWRKLPSTMLAKVAEAQALRRAFPHDLSGLYTADEMAQAEPPRSSPAVVAHDPAEPQQEQPADPLEALVADVQGLHASVLAAVTEQELRACWEAMRTHPQAQAVAEALVPVPAAWQRLDNTVDHVPAQVPLFALVKVAKQHLEDDPYEGGDTAQEPWPDQPQEHPDDLPASEQERCAYDGCALTRAGDLWCREHDPVSERDNNSPRVDPDRLPKGQGKAAARAAAEAAAQRAAEKQASTPRRSR